jgi:hypothetical protein
MATIAAVAAIGSAAYGMYSSGKSSKSQQKNLDKQMEEARRIREENKKISNTAFDDIYKLIDGVGSLSDYLDEGEKIGRAQSDYRMDYVLGDTQDDLRNSLGINTRLGNWDFSDVDSSIGKVLKSNFYDIASITRDMPTGSFANLSVANMANLAQQGLQNTISTGDYIGRISGIDQYTPYRMAQDLFTIERDEAGQRIQATNNRASQQIGVNTQWFQNFSDISNASNVVEATRNAAMVKGVSSIAGAVGGWSTGVDTERMQGRQQANADAITAKQSSYYDALIKQYS